LIGGESTALLSRLASRVQKCDRKFGSIYVPQRTPTVGVSASQTEGGALSLGGWTAAEIIRADEWGYYYPGRANLVIVKFTPGYIDAVNALMRLREEHRFDYDIAEG
jgi:hypothetical protein